MERAHERVIDRHHGAGVVEFAAVIGGGKDGHQFPTGKELVPVFHHLVGAHDEIQIVPTQELAHHVPAKGEGNTAVILSPALVF